MLSSCWMDHRRRGSMVTELFVTGILVFGTITILGKSASSSMRLRQETRHQQIALDELANHLELLTQMPLAQVEVAIEELKPSSEVAAVLPNATLKGTLNRKEDNSFIELSLDWNRSVPARPVRMVGWLSQATTIETSGGISP